MDKNQTDRWSKDEIEVIKKAFQGNEDLMYEIRNVLFGFSIKLSHKLPLDVLEVLRKMILPELTPDVPIGCQADMFVTSLRAIGETLPEIAYLQIEATDIAADYLHRRFNVLTGANDTGKSLLALREKGEKDEKERLVELLAYKVLVNSYIDSQLDKLQKIAGKVDKTEEERKKQILMDSAQ